MEYSSRVSDAFALARALHNGQKRRGSGVPYLTHLLAVAALVGEHGGDEEQFIAALLHDAVEDQGGQVTLDRIRNDFGAHVAELVLGASDADVIPKPPWQARKEQHVAHVATAGADLKLIVAADKLHNARCVYRDLRNEGAAVWQRFQGRCDGTLWYYAAMLEALRQDWSHPILDELSEAIDALNGVAEEVAR